MEKTHTLTLQTDADMRENWYYTEELAHLAFYR